MADQTQQVTQIRLLIADPAGTLLSDGQLESMLDLNSGNVRRAAADALEAIAVSEVLVSKKIRTQDLTTDGPAVSAELRALAKRLRDQADAEDDAADDGFFDIVDTHPTDGLRPEHTNPYRQVWGL